MIKALFLDLDETLCDTTGANNKALAIMAQHFSTLFGPNIDGAALAQQYILGIYRELDAKQQQRIAAGRNEEEFRHNLIRLLLSDAGITSASDSDIQSVQQSFDDNRTKHFDFFPGIKELLVTLRTQFTLVVITNGPEFSQVAKVERVQLKNYVDHIIIGGQEPEQKPAVSIFKKALHLAQCNKRQAIHFGDSLAADIQGANNAGIRSVWIRHNQVANAAITPNDIIEHPEDIPEFIKQHIQAAL
jgi:HAD superfamily hydrolase (TIGR01549 family)